MEIKKLSLEQYQDLIQKTTILKEKKGLPYVLLANDQMVIKHLYQRSWFSSSTFYPYAKRFIDKANKLKQLGFNVPNVKDIYKVKAHNCYLLTYDLIPGKTVSDIVRDGDINEIDTFIKFVARLHELGIFFRDFHMSNVVKMPNGQYCLIDVVSVKCFSKPLSLTRRARNIARVLNRRTEHTGLLLYGLRKFAENYMQQTNYPKLQQYKFYYSLNRRLRSRLRFWVSEY